MFTIHFSSLTCLFIDDANLKEYTTYFPENDLLAFNIFDIKLMPPFIFSNLTCLFIDDQDIQRRMYVNIHRQSYSCLFWLYVTVE